MCVCIELGDSFRRDPLVDRAVLSLGSSPNTYTRNAYCYFFLSDHVRTQEQSVARRVIRHLVAVFRHLGPLFAGFVRGPNPTKSPNSEFITDMWGPNPNSDPDFRGPNRTLGVRIF
jgi:hypothetical protein